jgi:CubicO group peptidase (beta-lactamase class C family)
VTTGRIVAVVLCVCCALCICARPFDFAPPADANEGAFPVKFKVKKPVTRSRARVAGGAAAAPQTCSTDLTRQLRVLDVPGLAAAIVKNGRIVCTAAAGMADIGQQMPVTPNTLFLIASVSKTIVATALMQLYDQEEFRLDDDVNDYLPFKVFIPAAPAAPITFRQLLTHTASIKDNTKYINCPGSCPYGSSLGAFVTRGADSPISLADFTEGYLTPGGAYYDPSANFQPSAPGTTNEYSNMGIVLAGYLVERISGMPFDRYCRDRIFTPLGMEKTSWRLAGIDRSLLAMPYDKSSSGYVPYGQFGEPDYPDGMLRTSVSELASFLIAYTQGGRNNGRQILKTSTVREMLRRQTPLDPAQGLAWVSQSVDGRTVWGHDGADNGAGANMWFDPSRDEGVILMTNGIWNDDSKLLAALFDEADGY